MLPPLTIEGEAQSTQPWLSGDAEKAYRVEDANVGMLGNKLLKDTPYSVEVYSSDLIKNKQARSLADITKGDASMGLTVDSLVTSNLQALTTRGMEFGANAYRIDNLAAITYSGNDLPLEHLERIDILKGAGGFLYGFGQPGGIINYVLKRPTDEPFRSLNMQVMDSGLTLIHGDVGGRLGPDDRFGYRVNLVHESGDTYINDGESRRNSGFIALDWEITPDLVWQFDAQLWKHMRKGGYNYLFPSPDGALFNFTSAKPPAPIDGSRRLAPSWSRFETNNESYGTNLSWNFAADWTLDLAHRQSKYKQEFGLPNIWSDPDGNYSLLLIYIQPDLNESSQSQALINGIFTTGPISHELTVGASYIETRQKFPDDINTRSIPNIGNLSNPVEVNNSLDAYFGRGPNLGLSESGSSHERALFLSDTLRVGEGWDIILGLRHINLDSKIFGNVYAKRAITPTLAAIFRPIDGLSLYGSYIEALERGATAPRTAVNANQVFPPIVSKQYEFGAKAETDDWSASAALFRMERALTYTTPANVFTQDGEARYQGLELNGKFRLSPSWLLTASAMWLDATNQKTTGGVLDGKRIAGAAREQLSLYGEYRMPGFPLTLTAGARYVGKRPNDRDSRFYHDDVTLFDMGARYETKVAGKGVTLRLNVDNLTDEAYWVTAGPANDSWFKQNTPRTIKLGIELEW